MFLFRNEAQLGKSIRCILNNRLERCYSVVAATELLHNITNDSEASPQEKSALTELLLSSIQQQRYVSFYTYTPGDMVELGEFGEGFSQGSYALCDLAERTGIPVIDTGNYILVNDDRDGSVNSVRAWQSCNCIFYPAILAV